MHSGDGGGLWARTSPCMLRSLSFWACWFLDLTAIREDVYPLLTEGSPDSYLLSVISPPLFPA